MRRSRGFVYYDLWILVTAVAIILVVIVPNVVRAVRKEKLRRVERAELHRIARVERAHYDRYHAYLDSLPFSLTRGIRLLGLRADTAGWSATVTADSSARAPATCGVFEGPPSLAPDPAATTPGRIACW